MATQVKKQQFSITTTSVEHRDPNTDEVTSIMLRVRAEPYKKGDPVVQFDIPAIDPKAATWMPGDKGTLTVTKD